MALEKIEYVARHDALIFLDIDIKVFMATMKEAEMNPETME